MKKTADADGGFGSPVAGQRVYDTAGVLTPNEASSLEARAADLARAGTPVVVYLRSHSAGHDATVRDAAQLMQDWSLESKPGAKDGLVLFFNLKPGDLHHGEAALYAGRTLAHGNLPQRELQRIFDDEMRPALKEGRLADGIAAGLAAAQHDLAFGPPPPAPPSELQRRAGELVRWPINLLTALLAAGVAWLAVQAWHGRPRPSDRVAPVPTTEPPDALTPAQAGALVTGGAGDAQLEATLLSFAAQGALAVEPEPRDDRKHRVQLRLLGLPAMREPFEGDVWQAIEAQAEDGVVGSGQIQRIRDGWKPAHDSLVSDLQARGWFDPAAPARRRRLYLIAAGALVLAVAGLVLALLGLEGWGAIGPALLLAAGIGAVVCGVALPATTPAGEDAAQPWRAYRDGLQAAARRFDAALDLDAVLPYAVALGIVGSLDRRLKRASAEGYAPAWFAGRGGGERAADLQFYPYWVVFHSSVVPPPSSSSSGAGGAAAGGAGAGGSF